MSKEYRLSIIVSGKDNGAKSMLGGIGSALGSMGRIAGGILAAGLLYKMGQGVMDVGRAAVNSVGKIQQMTIALTTLQARELARSGSLENLNRYATQNIGLTQTQAERLNTLRTTYDNLLTQQERARTLYGEESQNYKDITSALGDYEKKILEAASANGELSAEQRKVVLNQLSLNDALAIAEPLAKATLDELERIAIYSPYQFEMVQSTYQLAMAFGYTAKEATPFTQALLDVAAGVGADNEMLHRMAFNLTQIRKVGKVTMADIRQLAMVGFDLVDVLKYVGKQMGLNIKDHNDFNAALASGKITWEDFTTHFSQYATENFGGASERLSRTLTGLKSSFGDVFQFLLPRLFGKPLERITGWLQTFLSKLISLKDSGVLEAIGLKLDKFLARFEKIDFSKLKKLNLNDILQMGGDGWVNLSADLLDAVREIDWQEVTDKITSVLDSVDWNLLGQKLSAGLKNLLAVAQVVLTEVDWGSLFNTLVVVISDFFIGMFGLTFPEFVKIVDNTFTNLKLTANAKLEEFKGSLFAKFISIAGAVAMAIMTLPSIVGGGLAAVIVRIALFAIQAEQKMREVAKVFHHRAVGWMQQVIQGVTSMIGAVVAAIGSVIEAIKAAIRPIVIPISFGNPGNFPGFGGGGGGSTGALGGGAGSGGGGNRTNRNDDGFARGGIATGPRSGHWELLHGTEAVIPLQGGSVPVSLSGGGAGGGPTVNVVVNYAPFLSMNDRNEARERLAPFIADELRLLLSGA